MLEDVKKDKLVYGGKCAEMKVRLNSAFLFFNAALMREYFSEENIGAVKVQCDIGKKVLVLTPCEGTEKDSFTVGKVEKEGRVRYGYLPIKRIAATFGFKELLDNRSVPIRGDKEMFVVSLAGKK